MNNPLSSPKSQLISQYIFGAAFIIFIFCAAVRPLYDPDFWWHLKSGQFMIQQQGLMHQDPFAFAGDRIPTIREALILKGYWLWQIIAYGFYSLIGFKGISLFNFLVIALMSGATIYQFYRLRINAALSILLLTSGYFLFVDTYQFERPQIISFFFTCLLLNIFLNFKQSGHFNWSLPLLMLLWANLHGGFIVGVILLICFSSGALIEYRHDRSKLKHIFSWVTFAILASLLNPGGGLAFYSVAKFYNTPLMTGVVEYQSSFTQFSAGSYNVAILWILIALYAAGQWAASRRIFLPELVVALFLAWFSVMHMRNVGLFVPAMLPVIGSVLQAETAQRVSFKVPRYLQSAAVLLCGGFLLWLSYGLWHQRLQVGDVKQVYPEQAVEFLEHSGLQGHMFNSYEYGGYLLWRLAPKIKAFIDGRGIDTQVFNDYGKIQSASTISRNGLREFDFLLNKYQIDYVFQPVYRGDGSIQPLMTELLAKPNWIPVYQDNFVYIFSRLTPQNAETISQFRIEKNEFKQRLYLFYNYLVQQFPNQIGYQVARAGMLTYMGRYQEAKRQIERIRALSPDDMALSRLQRNLDLLLGKTGPRR